NGGSGLVQTVSRSHPQQCFSVSGIDTQTGNISNANDGINTRFDLYSGPFNSCKNDPEYGPASNVRKGVIPGNNACNPPNQSPPMPFGDWHAMGFPVDNNMITSTGQLDTSASRILGDGTWACGDIGANPTATVDCGGRNGCNGDIPITVGPTTG